VLFDLTAYELPLRLQTKMRRLVAQARPEVRRPLDVREEDGDYTFGKVLRHGDYILSQRAR
jgi:hypothetical protein